MRKLIIILFLLSTAKTFAQQYLTNSFTDAMKEKAHAIVRLHDTEFIVKNAGEATMKVNAAITILDENGDNHAILSLEYDKKFDKISNIEAYIYDASGKQVKKLKKADIINANTSSDDEIGDGFVKFARLNYSQYPYTIAYSYEYSMTNMMFYPKWEAISDNAENTSVEKSSLTISMPKELQLRYREQNIPVKVSIQQDGNRTIYSWKVENLKAVEKEANSPKISSLMPMVYTAPTDFKVEDYAGNFNTWQDFGVFYNNLNKNRDKLPFELVEKMRAYVKGETDVVKKTQKIYEYLQANTRYMSIQLGIGGWQTAQAEEVAQKGYGDCKALTNFTQAILKEFGIRSYYTLASAGRDKADIIYDFPSAQFNHVFLCVPNQRDTLWLECTSQTNPFGYLGSFTGDRHVLLVTENGGKLLKTHSYKSTDNQQVTNSTIQLNENGEATANVTILYTGLQQETPAALINQLGKEEQKKWILKNLELPSAELNQFSLTEHRAMIPSVTQQMNLSLRNISNKSGTRIFLTPNLLNQEKNVPVPNSNRKMDFVQAMNYMDTDTIVYKIPANYTAEYLPEPIKFQSKFGNYTSSVEMKENIIKYIRQVTILKGQFPPADYTEWVNFRKKIVKADRNQVILVGK